MEAEDGLECTTAGAPKGIGLESDAMFPVTLCGGGTGETPCLERSGFVKTCELFPTDKRPEGLKLPCAELSEKFPCE